MQPGHPSMTWLWAVTVLVTALCCAHCAGTSGLSALCGQGMAFDPAAGALVPATAMGRIAASPQCLALIAISFVLTLGQLAPMRGTWVRLWGHVSP